MLQIVLPHQLRLCMALIVGFSISISISKAQMALPLQDLSYFKSPSKSWAIVGGVTANLNKENNFKTSKGTGVLVNEPDNGNGADLYTTAEFGDVDVELDYMMAKGSNSGIYLQGRYEIQLLDSWGKKNPKYGDNGGIYERWDDSKPEGQKGYQGFAPRQNVSKAPGLWQHIKISFQAPRFNASGQKTENAKILKIELNGVTVHENVILQGPTRGAVSNTEAATGPLRIQGDHGAVAFKNITITTFDKPRPRITDIGYSVYKGRFTNEGDLKKLPPEAKGTLPVLSASSISGVPSEFFIYYKANIEVAEAGTYSFNVVVPGGNGILKINNQILTPQGRNQQISANLPAGKTPIELLYVKNQDWTNRSLSIGISGPGIREYFIGDAYSTVAQNSANPIYVEANTNTMLRSFMDIPGGKRVVHAINVGSPDNLHYTYDLDNGALFQMWRGDFLDATPMWYSRGDGSSRPLGTVLRLGEPNLLFATLNNKDAEWIKDTTGSSYKPNGYEVDKTDKPVFMYQLYGASVKDDIRVMNDGQGIGRNITVSNAPDNLYARIAVGKNIAETENNWYIIDDNAYYIQVNNNSGKPFIRESNGSKELLVPVKNDISYTVFF